MNRTVYVVAGFDGGVFCGYLNGDGTSGHTTKVQRTRFFDSEFAARTWISNEGESWTWRWAEKLPAYNLEIGRVTIAVDFAMN